ncbi:unnamed protein product [Cylicostephanus goldi]|uniref:Uncharacterized protein n=1 Tax=Cylicostephanus goldi TaxID=71465 RepID=A0A3P7LS84_CYLGO|nr:unnamed protein product [Cylicostephanus goldi]
MFAMKQEFNNLLSKKREFLSRQRTSSLLINPLKTAENDLIPEFSNFYRRLSNAPMAPEEHTAQLSLIEQVIQESIIIEWPRCVEGLPSSSESVEIDMAPLIHRARSVVKCRTSHPTMKIKVCAISQDIDGPLLPQPKTVEAFFRASLVKLSHDGTEPRSNNYQQKLPLSSDVVSMLAHLHRVAFVFARAEFINLVSAKRKEFVSDIRN